MQRRPALILPTVPAPVLDGVAAARAGEPDRRLLALDVGGEV